MKTRFALLIASVLPMTAHAAVKPSYRQELKCVIAAYHALGDAVTANTHVYSTDVSEDVLFEIAKNYPSICRTFWPGNASAAANSHLPNCEGLTGLLGAYATPACLASAIQAGRSNVTGN